MDISTKIERIKTEIAFLVEGAGTLEEKQAALVDVVQFTDAKMADEAAKPVDVQPAQ